MTLGRIASNPRRRRQAEGLRLMNGSDFQCSLKTRAVFNYRPAHVDSRIKVVQNQLDSIVAWRQRRNINALTVQRYMPNDRILPEYLLVRRVKYLQ